MKASSKWMPWKHFGALHLFFFQSSSTGFSSLTKENIFLLLKRNLWKRRILSESILWVQTISARSPYDFVSNNNLANVVSKHFLQTFSGVYSWCFHPIKPFLWTTQICLSFPTKETNNVNKGIKKQYLTGSQ